MYTVNMTVLILLGFIAIAIGLILGIMVGSLRSTRRSRQDDIPMAPPPPKDLTDIVHLWRRKSDNSLVVEFELEGLSESASELSDKQQRTLALALLDLSRWLGLPQTANPTRSVDEQMLPPSKMVVKQASPAGLVTPSGVPIAASSTVGTAPANLSPGKPKVPTSSIASQINDILQEMLINTPLERRGIRLYESLGKGMVVMVGLNQYDSVDEVPDEIVRKVIKLAVQKWEKQMSS